MPLPAFLLVVGNAIINGVFATLNSGIGPSEASEKAMQLLEEERLREEAERERQRKKTAPPGSQSIPKPTAPGPIPKPPTAPPLTPVEPDDDLTVIPPAKAKAKDVNFAPKPGPPQKPIWEDPIEAVRNWVFPGPTTPYVKLGTLLRVNYIKGDTLFSRWNRVTEPETYWNQVKLSYGNFLSWLGKKTGANALEGETGQIDQFWDQSATIWFNIPGQLDGHKGIIYGLEPLGMAFGEYFVLSRTASFGGVRGMLYESITVENYKAPWSRQPDNNLQEIYSEGGEGLAYGLATSIALTQDLDEYPKVILENNYGAGGRDAENFPIRVPVSLLIEDDDLANMTPEEIKQKAYVNVNSMPELMLWFVRIFDEIVGKFPLTFEIGESDMLSLEEEMDAWEQSKAAEPDPSLPFYLQNDKLVSFSMKDGRRVKRIKVPNLAEALSELSALSLVQDQQSGMAQEFMIRLLQESGSTKQTAIQTYYMADAIIDWLGFATKEVTQEVDFSWQPNLDDEETALTMRELLRPTKVPVSVVWENEKENFQKAINVLIEAHAIVKAAHTEGIGANPTQLKNRILKFAEAYEPNPQVKKEAKSGEVIDETITTEFDEFLDRVEKGFTDAPYITDSTKPYGKPYENRPKIKRVEGDLID